MPKSQLRLSVSPGTTSSDLRAVPRSHAHALTYPATFSCPTLSRPPSQVLFQKQGFAWVTYQHNRPTNAALYVHKLETSAWLWQYVDSLLAVESPYAPVRRECVRIEGPDGPVDVWSRVVLEP